MKVRLEDIPPEGLEVAFEDRLAKPAELGDQVAGLTAPPQARLRLERQGELVLGRGGYRAGLRLVCSRCLQEVEAQVGGPLEWVFGPVQPVSDAEEVQLNGEDMDALPYEGDELDLAQALRGEIGLSLPMAPLCRPDCRGLCPACGKPLAEGDCGCRQGKSDPRWAKLAELKLK